MRRSLRELLQRLPGGRRTLIAGAAVLGVGLAIVLGLFVVYPRVGAWMIRSRVGDRLAARLGRDVSFGDIDVSLGHAVLRDLEIRGPLDGASPLAHVDRVDVEFDAWSSLVGSIHVGAVAIDGVAVSLRRAATGEDNVRDLVDRLRGHGANPDSEGGDSGDVAGRFRPTGVTAIHLKLAVIDEVTGGTAAISDGDATWRPGEMVVRALGVSGSTLHSPKATLARLEVHKKSGEPPIVAIDGGELAVWPKLSLSGITGQITAVPDRPGEYAIDLSGGYGGVPGKLWTAKGGLIPSQLTGSLDLVAAKFQLAKLSPILEQSPIVDYAGTSVDTNLHVDFDAVGTRFAGGLHVTGLNVGHPMIADKEVHDLDLSAQVAGSYDRKTRRLELTRGDFVARDVPFSVTGAVTQVHRQAEVVSPPPASATSEPPPPRYGPAGIDTLQLQFVIPPINCQRALTAIPPEMVPYMNGYKLRGMFDAEIDIAIDWADLDATKLDGHVGIAHCKVIDEPEDSPKRLKDEFEHYVEVDKGDWLTFVVGPSNEDFVPLDQISPYLIKSIMTTEDSAFYQHHGFIPSEFKSALITDLKAGGFKYGASSITMQFVKNVLLYREKTLARKLQELFLTWHVENTLTKDRIMEIYLNVIEYGPGLYGIGPASWHFFSKPAKDLSPVEAAFFSTILPAPKERYKQYCNNTLTKWTTDKIQRILGIMLKRDRLTQAEYDQAMATPLLFAKDDSETEEECLERVKKAIKNARSTNPLAKDDDKPDDQNGHGSKRDKAPDRRKLDDSKPASDATDRKKPKSHKREAHALDAL